MNLLLIFLGKKQEGKRDYTEGDVSAQLSTVLFIFPDVILFTVWRKKCICTCMLAYACKWTCLQKYAYVCVQIDVLVKH